MDEQWKLEMEDVSTTVVNSVGALCLSITTATYLATLTPYEQMEAINSELIPLFEERGVKLCWNKDNGIANALMQVTQGEQRSSFPEGQEEVPNVGCYSGESVLSPVRSPNNKQEHVDVQDCSKLALSSSYTSCSSNIQSLLVEEQFLNKWLTSGCTSASLAYMMPCSLIHTVWNRWPLVCDPDGYASKWIKEYVGDELICLDGHDRYLLTHSSQSCRCTSSMVVLLCDSWTIAIPFSNT